MEVKDVRIQLRLFLCPKQIRRRRIMRLGGLWAMIVWANQGATARQRTSREGAALGDVADDGVSIRRPKSIGREKLIYLIRSGMGLAIYASFWACKMPDPTGEPTE